jgi:hypothetical protein
MNNIDQLYEFYKPEFEIYEGLITSQPLYLTDMILKKHYNDIKPNYKENTFFLRHNFNENYFIAKKELDKIIQMTNNLGWFPSIFSSYDINDNYKKREWDPENENVIKDFILQGFTNILFSFEAKYDIPEKRYPRFLYHVCETRFTDKILKYGLSPKSRSQRSYHPSRIYLTKTIKDARDYAYKRFKEDKIEYQDILMIDTITIKIYLRLYRDPNYIGKAYYTLNHITPYCIRYFENANY